MHSFVSKSWFAGLFCATLLCLATVIKAQEAHTVAADSGTASPGIREMQKVDDRWSDAVTKRDQYALELVLSPQFIGISAAGEVTTRNQQIANLFIKGEAPLSLEQKVISARFINDVAIVNGTYVMRWKLPSGPLDEKGIYSQVFEHSRGNWLCINSQRTVVAEKGKEVAVKEKPRPKSSSAELPLHIPLVYKGPSSNAPSPAPGSTPPSN